MGSALETLCGQSFGAKQNQMLGIHLQRAMLVLLTTSIPLAVVWAFTDQILLAFGQDPEISSEAGSYARMLVPALFAYGLLQCYARFLQTQNIVLPLMLTSAATTLIHFLVCWLLVYRSGLGNKGAAIANSISYWINVLLLAVYVRVSPSCRETWTGFSAEAFHGVLSFIKLAVPSATMICFEFWAFELLVFLSGLLPNPKLETSALSIILNTSTMLFMIPFGFGAAISTRVSNELGANRPMAARLAVRVVVISTISVGLIIGFTILLLRNIWGYVYSNEEEVVKHVAAILPVLAVSNFLDGTQSVLSELQAQREAAVGKKLVRLLILELIMLWAFLAQFCLVLVFILEERVFGWELYVASLHKFFCFLYLHYALTGRKKLEKPGIEYIMIPFQ